jgi:hypothetical protein
MSFDVSWAAFHKVRKQEVLATASLQNTGQHDEANEAPFSCAELPNEWTILYANNSTYIYENIKTISENHAVLSVIIQDYVPTSLAAFHVRGKQVWSVYHEGNAGVLDLTLTGAVPPQTTTIRDRLLILQQREEGKVPRVDHMFDVPVELAESICGYRHDRWRFSWGQPVFTVAEPRRS